MGVPGYSTEFELWYVPYFLGVLLTSCMFIWSLVQSRAFHDPSIIHRTRWWILLPAGVGILTAALFPYNIVFMTLILVVQDELGAPLGATLILSVFLFGGWILSLFTAFTPPNLSRHSQ